MIALLLALLTMGCAWGIGMLVLPRRMPYHHFTALGTGLCVLVAVLFGTYALGIVSQDTFIILGGGSLVLGLMGLWRARLSVQVPELRGWDAAIAAAILFLAVFHIVGAGAPSIDADGLGYHLLVPKLWNEVGGFTVIPWNMYAAWPMNFDLFYGAGLAFGSQLYGRFLHALIGIAAVCLTIAAGSKYGTRAGLLAGLLLISLPMVGVLSGTSYVDLFVLYCMLLVFLLIEEWRKGILIPVLAGLLAGAAVGAKITGYPFAVATGAWFFYVAWTKHRPIALRATLAFAAAGAILSVPWLVKSWAAMGNPVWPFLYGTLGGEHWSSYAASQLATEVSSSGQGPLAFLLFPFVMTGRSALFGEMGFIGAAWLALGGLAFLFMRKGRNARMVGTFVLAHLVVFFFLLHQIRYIIFVFPVLAILIGRLATMEWKPEWMGSVIVGFLVLSVALNLPFALAYNGKSVGVSQGWESRENYLMRNFPPYEPIAWANRNLPEDAVVFTGGETWTFYLEREQRWGSPRRQAVVDYGVISSGEELAHRLDELGVTHVMISSNTGSRDPSIRTIEQEMIVSSCEILFESERGLVCRLTSGDRRRGT